MLKESTCDITLSLGRKSSSCSKANASWGFIITSSAQLSTKEARVDRFESGQSLAGSGGLEPSLTQLATVANRFQVCVEGVELDAEVGGFVVIRAITGEVGDEPPVILLCRFLDEGMVLGCWPDDEVAEPAWKLLNRLLVVDIGLRI